MAHSKPSEAKQFTDDDLITCGICHIEIEHPRSLICLHTYCLRCLREWSKKNTKDAVICPVCRETTPLPSDGVDGLRSNFFVTKLKDRKVVSRQLMEKDVKIMCTSCDVSDMHEAVSRCVECDDFLCDKCVQAHKSMRILKNHIVISLEDLRSGKAKLTQQSQEECCIEHRGQVLWFYCKTCGVPICRDCTVVDHPVASHDLVKLTVAIVGQREEITKLASSCEEKHHSILKSQEEIQAIEKDLEDASDLANASIDKAGQNVMKAVTESIQRQCDDRKAEVSLMKSKNKKVLSEAADKLEVLQSRFNSALEMSKQVTKTGSDCDVASVYSSLTTTLKQLETVQPSVPSKNLSKLVFVDKSHMVGLTCPFGRIQGGSAFSADATWRLERKFGETGEGELEEARGITSLGDGEIAVADYDASKVHIYSVANGDVIRSIDTRQAPSRYDDTYTFNVVKHCEGSLIVTDADSFPAVYDSSGTYKRQIKLSGHDRNTRGIAINSKGQILIGNYKSKKIDIVDYKDGKHHSTINVKVDPDNIALSSTGQIIITDNNSIAQVIDDSGYTIHTLCPPKDATTRWCPTGLCTIGEAEEEVVLICNSMGTSGVYCFSLATSKYLGCITTDLRDPYGIAFIDNELYIGDQTCVKVFKCID